MTALPPELAPWRQALAPLAPDLALFLGPWMQRLRGALGPLPTATASQDGEVDGYGALARRGPYERLLLSEWALARAQPLEFLRRAALGEHLFLDAERKSPQEDRRLVALFDGGPEQLGSPRLAHLAVLAVLHQRAETAEASFAWGFVAAPETLHEGFDNKTFRQLLAGRSTTPPQQDHLEAWTERLRSGTQSPECWWIGGEALALFRPKGSHSLRVEEAPEGQLKHLRVLVESPGRPVRRLKLTLPKASQRVRLLRDPFAPMPRKGLGPSLTGAVRFSTDANRLLFQDKALGIIALHVPNGPRESQGRHRRVAMEEGVHVATASIVGHRWLTVVRRGETWEVRGAGTRRQRKQAQVRTLEVIEDEPATLAPGDPLPPPCWQDPMAISRHQNVPWPLVFVDARGALFAVDPFEHRQMTRFYPKVAGIARVIDQLAVAVEDPGTEQIPPRSLVAFEHSADPIELPGDGPLEVLFGTSGAASNPLHCVLLAWRREATTWGLLQGGSRRVLYPGQDCEVLGVTRGGPQHEVGLLVLEADRRTVQHVGLRFSRMVFKADDPVAHHAFHPNSSRLALVLDQVKEERRELVIWDLVKNHFCLRQTLGAGPP